VARGKVKLNGTELSAGDGVKVNGESELRLTEGADAEVLLFDLA
jgi:redox-sensitive bicupin YhaK (pirin superfamily)